MIKRYNTSCAEGSNEWFHLTVVLLILFSHFIFFFCIQQSDAQYWNPEPDTEPQFGPVTHRHHNWIYFTDTGADEFVTYPYNEKAGLGDSTTTSTFWDHLPVWTGRLYDVDTYVNSEDEETTSYDFKWNHNRLEVNSAPVVFGPGTYRIKYTYQNQDWQFQPTDKGYDAIAERIGTILLYDLKIEDKPSTIPVCSEELTATQLLLRSTPIHAVLTPSEIEGDYEWKVGPGFYFVDGQGATSDTAEGSVAQIIGLGPSQGSGYVNVNVTFRPSSDTVTQVMYETGLGAHLPLTDNTESSLYWSAEPFCSVKATATWEMDGLSSPSADAEITTDSTEISGYRANLKIEF